MGTSQHLSWRRAVAALVVTGFIAGGVSPVAAQPVDDEDPVGPEQAEWWDDLVINAELALDGLLRG